MGIDLTRIVDQLNAFWDTYGYAVIMGVGLLGLTLVGLGLYLVIHYGKVDRLLATIAAVVVLAWTSEGMWEVARDPLGLPVGFAIATFFVFEAMLLRAIGQAQRHRRMYGVPGPAGRYVWVLTAAMAVIVTANAATSEEALLRLLLPLAAAGLWWVDITAERPEDAKTIGVDGKTLARLRAEARGAASSWTVTPTAVLVRLRLKRPGAMDMTEAEREFRRRRMVTLADRWLAASPGSHARQWAAYRLRRLARMASAEDIAEVRAQVERTAHILALVLPPNVSMVLAPRPRFRWRQVAAVLPPTATGSWRQTAAALAPTRGPR